MTIEQYIESRSMQRVVAVPPLLAHKFSLADDVEFYADASLSRYVGLCKARNLFAAWKPEAITTGEINIPYSTLRSF